jgi:hypothetical protein
MNIKRKYFISAFLIFVLLAGWVRPVYADDLDSSDKVLVKIVQIATDTPTPTYTPTPTDTPLATNTPTITPTSTLTPTITPTFTITPTPTNTPPNFKRPQIVIGSYTSNTVAQMGKKFKISINFNNNAGTLNAVNVQVVFTSSDVVPTSTGGVLALGSIPIDGQVDTTQTFYTAYSTAGKNVVVIDVALTYYDEDGTAYSDKFSLNVATKNEPTSSGGSGGAIYPTATPTGSNTAQLVITSYASNVDPLQPGEKFKLSITVQNMGKTNAKQVTMIVGGGSSGTSGGTAQPGGVSGGSGEFTNFAPIGTSNIQSLGDIAAGGVLEVSQNLVVNVSTNPGAYPMKITFSYVNSRGEVVNDDQIITLLVFSLPNVDVSFYSLPAPFFIGQSGALPIQVVNLGKRSIVLGNMKIETETGTVDPATTLVGSLDPGGYFTFDSTLLPDAAGPQELNITIEYTDDFNQPRTVTRALSITVEEASAEQMPDPGMGGSEFPVAGDETFFQKAWRFALGLFGLDSAAPTNDIPTVDPSLEQMPIPLPSGGGGGKGG